MAISPDANENTEHNEFDDEIAWEEEELEAPACDLSNPDICDSCQ